ncbi:MAG: site-specific integrase, partial [Candidatus Omnitrophica bacterium]|nr:site-specific integrase [Candidatus Omnitrophota bacterium]
MNSSLTNREVYVNQYVAKQRDNGFLIRGLTPFTLGRKFSLRRIKTGTWSLSGTVLNGKRNRVRKRFHALGLEEAVHEAEQILYGRAAESTDDLLIPDCFSKWMNTLSVRPDTMRNYRTHTNFFLDWCESEGIRYWRDLRLEHLEAYAQSLVEAKKKPRTIKLY